MIEDSAREGVTSMKLRPEEVRLFDLDCGAHRGSQRREKPP